MPRSKRFVASREEGTLVELCSRTHRDFLVHYRAATELNPACQHRPLSAMLFEMRVVRRSPEERFPSSKCRDVPYRFEVNRHQIRFKPTEINSV